MIVYISELRPDFLDDICDKLYLIVSKIKETNLKRLIIGNAADFSHASMLVVDLSCLKNTTDEIIETIGAFQSMYSETRIVVIADREQPNSPIFARLYDMGVYDIVVNLNDDILKKCLTVGMTKEDVIAYKVEKPNLTSNAVKEKPETPAIMPTVEKIMANMDFKKHKQFVTVAVCGTEPHIGATHNALLLAKFLNNIGFKVCYLEANERRNILYIAKIYNVNANEQKHMLQFEGIDMYFDFKLPDVIVAGYDFYIFDLGRFSEIELTSFLTKDMKIIIGGTKAWEMPAYSTVFDTIDGNRDIRFIMTHAPPSEFDMIRELMESWKIYFSEYAPYPFSTGVNLDIYKDIFKDYINVQSIKSEFSEKKKGFFDKWRR